MTKKQAKAERESKKRAVLAEKSKLGFIETIKRLREINREYKELIN